MLKSLLAAVVTLALLTCPFPARAYEKTILKVGMGDPIDSEMGAIGTRFKEVVEARSEGKVEVQLFPSGQLGDETEMIQNVRAGNLDIAVVGIANTVPFVKKLGILTMPYLLTTCTTSSGPPPAPPTTCSTGMPFGKVASASSAGPIPTTATFPIPASPSKT